jgi:hypothetical protein
MPEALFSEEYHIQPWAMLHVGADHLGSRGRLYNSSIGRYGGWPIFAATWRELPIYSAIVARNSVNVFVEGPIRTSCIREAHAR